MKKLLALILCLTLAVSVFAGCGGGGGLEAAGEGNEGPVATMDQQEIPEDLTLTIGIPLSASVEDYDTNAYTLWLEEQTGYDLEFITFQSSSTDYKAQLSTMLATGDELPDILWNFQVGQGAYEEYGASGYFIDMAPYYNDKEGEGKVFWDRLSQLPQDQQDYVVRQLTAEDGGMYAAARIEYSLIDTMQFQVFINQTWLTNLGLEMPTNIDELETVLRAFRDKDPNGNGKKDELPLIGNNAAGSSSIIKWILNMYCYVDFNKYFNVDDNGKLYLPHITPEYRQALIKINQWIKEGLMFNSAFSMSNKEIKSLLNPPEGEALTVGVFAGHPTLVHEVDNSAIYNYVAMPYWGNAIRNPQYFTPAVFITQDCEYPLAAWRLIMTASTKEGSYRQRYGEYGVDYVDADPGTKSFLGRDAEIKVLNESAFSGQNNCCWHGIMGTILIEAENEVCQLTEDMGKWVNYKMTNMAAAYNNYVKAETENNPDPKYIMPDIVTPVEVSEADANERSNSQSVISEALSSFCCGTGTYNNPNDDAQWNAYIKALEEQGYQKWMEYRQAVCEDQFPEQFKK